jgi:hypothetical protein
MIRFRTTKRPAYSTLRANGREPMMQWPMRMRARNDVQNRADAPEGETARPENGQSRSGASDRQEFGCFLYGR